MHLPSKRGIEYFQLSMFPTNRGICFSLKANPSRCNVREEHPSKSVKPKARCPGAATPNQASEDRGRRRDWMASIPLRMSVDWTFSTFPTSSTSKPMFPPKINDLRNSGFGLWFALSSSKGKRTGSRAWAHWKGEASCWVNFEIGKLPLRTRNSWPPPKKEMNWVLKVSPSVTSEGYFSAELNLVLAQLNERLALVQLYQALGGGWQQ